MRPNQWDMRYDDMEVGCNNNDKDNNNEDCNYSEISKTKGGDESSELLLGMQILA